MNKGLHLYTFMAFALSSPKAHFNFIVLAQAIQQGACV